MHFILRDEIGYNNVDVNAANKYVVAVGNTPGVLTETTAELAASLSLAAARRIVEADAVVLADTQYAELRANNADLRAGLGEIKKLIVKHQKRTESFLIHPQVTPKTDRVIPNTSSSHTTEESNDYEVPRLQGELTDHNQVSQVTSSLIQQLEKLTDDDLIKHTLNGLFMWMVSLMKKEAILINCSSGPVIDEVALVEHLRENPMFRVGLNVFEDEPNMKPGLLLK
ncbi:hypothetical protein ACFE04_015610 [Oxalis oulophora]